MTARPNPDAFVLDEFLRQQGQKSLLRFIACGSVDHGKSTLIGRLLYEGKLLLEDQLDALSAESRKSGTLGEELDFSLLVDGLAAEREQNITIDVAYRFFVTERRKFIVADCPGHDQYTPNMATGASTADLALVLVSAESGLTRQTKRHTLIVSMLSVRKLVLVVNKMDLVGWSEPHFRAIEGEFRAFAQGFGASEILCIPTSARHGDNVVSRSSNTNWYRGPALLEHLEEVDVAVMPLRQPFRMPVQWVNRPNANFRGYSGLITGGEIEVGAPVLIGPSGQVSRVERIVTSDGDLSRAHAGQSVTLTFTEAVDVSRGDVIATLDRPPAAVDRLSARIFWMGREALVPGRSYLFKLGTCSAAAVVEAGLSVLDLDTRTTFVADRLAANEIGHCILKLDRPIAVDRYAESKETGGFILIDPETYDTLALGIVEEADPAEHRPAGQLGHSLTHPQRAVGAAHRLVRGTETHARSVAKAVSWRATGSLDTFIVAYVITGSPAFAGSIAFTEIITKILFYYFHERIWSFVSWGKRALPG